ncbi:MAG: hypothetical protein WKF79_02360 [Nocardioides sp.]
MPSTWTPSKHVDIDAYAANPLVDDLRQAAPQLYELAMGRSPAPTLFAGGNLPIFLASGEDPGALMSIPWIARHVAAAASADEFARLFEACSGEPKVAMANALLHYAKHTGNAVYRHRVDSWRFPSNQ